MECPKCGKEVSDDATVCPHCKKVLKMICPKCETANTTPVCKKCGFTILSKCDKCGTITPTIKGTCSKCGFSTYVSVSMASANIDQFAVLTIDLMNLEDINEVLGSKRLIEKFKVNIDNLILGYCELYGLSRQIIDGLYVIKFDKYDSYNESAKAAILGAVDIAKSFIFMNFKLQKSKAISLEFRMAVLKRDVNTLPDGFVSGLEIKLVSNYPKEFKYLNNIMIYTDSNIYQEIEEDYSLNSLSSSYINGEMVAFFELNLKKHLKVEEPKEEEEAQGNIAQLEEVKETLIDEYEEVENKLYNNDTIIFDDMKCSFNISNAYDVSQLIADEITQHNKQIFMIKSNQNFKPESDYIISFLESKKLVAKIYEVSCYEEMKYKPYGFFNELIRVMNSFTRSPNITSTNNFNTLASLDQSNMLRSIINLEENSSQNIEDARNTMYDIFYKIVSSMGKIIIYINNFELIDETSYEFLKKLWNDIPQNLIFISSINMDYNFHKTSHFLFQCEKYSEIRLKPLSIKHIVESDSKRFTDFATSYYFTNIMQSMKGSFLFFNMAVSYLYEQGIISKDKDSISVQSSKICVIPNGMDYLMLKRLQTLYKKPDHFKVYSILVMTSPMSDINLLKQFEINNLNDVLNDLTEYSYISIYDTNVYVNNFDIAQRNIGKVLNEDAQKELIKEIIAKAYSDSYKSVDEIKFYSFLNDIESQQKVLEYSAALCASTGDYSAYLNCVVKLKGILEKNLPEETKEEELEKFKINLYENVSRMLNKYTPKKIYSVSKNILTDLEKSDDLTKLIRYSIKLIKTSMICGNYSFALDLINKTLARLNEFTINPAASNYSSLFFYVSMMRIIALFSVGKMRECEELGNEVISFIKAPNLANDLPEEISAEEFNIIIINAMTFVVLSKVFLLRKEESVKAYIEEIKSSISNVPGHFDFMPAIKDVMLGKEISLDLNSDNDEKLTKIVKATLRAFTINKEDNTKFANDIYEAKICANINYYSQLEILFDLLIGYAYFKLNALEKAKTIYNNVIELSEINGFKLAEYIACYLMSMLYYGIDETETALGLANNTVSHIERDNNVGDYLFYLFRVLTSGIYMDLGEEDKALACTQSAVFVKKKDDVVFGLEDVDIEAVERRGVIDRRSVKDDYGGRRKGQRRITEDVPIENVPTEKQDAKKHSVVDDMKELEKLQQSQQQDKKQKEEDLKLLKEKQVEDKKKESEMKKALQAAEKLKKEEEKRRKEEEEMKKAMGGGIYFKKDGLKG